MMKYSIGISVLYNDKHAPRTGKRIVNTSDTLNYQFIVMLKGKTHYCRKKCERFRTLT